MNPHLSDDSRAFGEVAGSAFASAGGVDLARRAEVDPGVRDRDVGPLLDKIGAGDLDLADPDAVEAAAALCREAGRVALPWPVVPALLGGLSIGWRADHADLLPTWRVADLDGDVELAAPSSTALGTRLGPFVGDLEPLGENAVADRRSVALHLTLTAFVVAGALAEAVRLATTHVVGRVQFDQPLSSFQAVQFQLADAHTAVAGLDEVAQFGLWRCVVAPDDALGDALGARLAALDAARPVLRIAQQLHGAAGVCDEYDVSVIARHLQPALRLPFGSDTTATRLASVIATDGFAGLFPHRAADRKALP